jgi:hypothetical protein
MNESNTAFRVLAWLIVAFGVVLAVITTLTSVESHASLFHWLTGIFFFTLPPVIGGLGMLQSLRSAEARATQYKPPQSALGRYIASKLGSAKQ